MGCGCCSSIRGALPSLPGGDDKQMKLLEMARKNEYICGCHAHPLRQVNEDNGWACDGRKAEGGCLNKCTDFHQSKGWARYRCGNCDYDLCDKCLSKNLTL